MKKAFTLAEVLITLAIIGVVATLTIPSVISNYQQMEYKTGLKKAVNVLNDAIRMNIQQEGETPYENTDIVNYLKRKMNVKLVRNGNNGRSCLVRNDGRCYMQHNYSLYSSDGMRFDIPYVQYDNESLRLKLHESDVRACSYKVANYAWITGCMGCGSYGLAKNPNMTIKPPCVIMVDTNGDNKPWPPDIKCTTQYCAKVYFPKPQSNKVIDVFSIMITDEKAVPFGVVAQRAMYGK